MLVPSVPPAAPHAENFAEALRTHHKECRRHTDDRIYDLLKDLGDRCRHHRLSSLEQTTECTHNSHYKYSRCQNPKRDRNSVKALKEILLEPVCTEEYKQCCRTTGTERKYHGTTKNMICFLIPLLDTLGRYHLGDCHRHTVRGYDQQNIVDLVCRRINTVSLRTDNIRHGNTIQQTNHSHQDRCHSQNTSLF